MSNPDLDLRARTGRTPFIVTLCLMTVVSPGAAAAWNFPLLPHVHSVAFSPEPPNNEMPTSIVLSAHYPSDCYRLVGAQRLDSAHVSVELAPLAACSPGDSSWTAGFELGRLAAGSHTLTVHATVQNASSVPDEEEITVPFEVADNSIVPPEDPGAQLVFSIDVSPTNPHQGEAVSIRLAGRTPFECTLIHDEQVVDPQNIYLAFAHAESCADTARQWSRTFAMGAYAVGDHSVDLTLEVNGPDSNFVVLLAAIFHVSDPDTSSTIDSTSALVSSISVERNPLGPANDLNVEVRGRFPFDCGTLEAPFLDRDGHLGITLTPSPGCSDSSRNWAYQWPLGPQSDGDHMLQLDVRLRVSGLTTSHFYPITFHVGSPPPPPVDSVRAGLSTSHPNPFHDETSFAVSLSEAQVAEVAVFDLGGRRVSTIHRGLLPMGTSNLAWNGRRSDGSRAPGGIYFYRLTLPGRVVTRRVVLLGAP